jgi:lysophospholipid acyltransferase (LPLAT)-like uncharacterized protein
MTVASESSTRKSPPARRSGIVTPRKLKWYHHLMSRLIYISARIFSATWRCTMIDPHRVLDAASKPIIFCVWHNRLALSMETWQRVQQRVPSARLVALISASHDGGLLARVLHFFNVEAVRGSSSRRGAQALLELTTFTARGYYVAITPDGPRGPRYVVQEGVLALAQLSGLPIVPVSVSIRGKLVTKSWDKFQIPLPFARCDLTMGELLHVPREASEEKRRELQAELQRRMTELTKD